jgi:hypothetical protein
MNSLTLAKDYLRKAIVRLEALNVFYQRESYDDVVREAQETVELVLKGALRCIGVDPPKRHDPAPVLRAHRSQLPIAWQERIEWIEQISAELFKERSQAFYGDEWGMIPASELYSAEDAEQAITWVKDLVQLYQQMLTDLLPPERTKEAEAIQRIEEADEHEQPE